MSIFEQIWEWVAANIVPILSSTTFMAIVGFVIYIIRTRGTVGENTTTNRKLSNDLLKATKETEALQREVVELKGLLYDIADTARQLVVKEDGILSVLQTVYSGLKPEIASTVNNIVNNVKYTASKTRDDIAGNLEAVGSALKTAVETIEGKVNETKRIVGKENSTTKVSL